MWEPLGPCLGSRRRRLIPLAVLLLGAVGVVACNDRSTVKATPTTAVSKIRARAKAIGGKGHSSSPPEGSYAVEINTKGCGLFALDTGTMLVAGDNVTVQMQPTDSGPSTPVATFTGTITRTGTSFKILVRDGTANTDPTISMSGSVSGDSLTGSSTFGGVMGGGSGQGYGCDQPFTATAGSGAMPSTTTLPTVAPPTTSVDIASLPARLRCADLFARGLPFTAAMDYWNLHGHPPLMDADHNGVPCETVYPRADITAYQTSHGGVPSTVATGTNHPCDLNHFLGDAGEDVAIDSISCAGDFALVKNHNNVTGAPFAPYVLHWDAVDGGWAGFITGPSAPECAEAPAQYRQYACTPS